MSFFNFFKRFFQKDSAKSSSYLIELRLAGDTKHYLKSLIFKISSKFRVRGVTRNHVVPHVTVFGPFKCSQEKELLAIFMKTCKAVDLPTYELDGFGNFNDQVVHVKIKASEELKQLRNELCHSLKPICNFIQPHDEDCNNFESHATLAFKDISGKFDSITNYLKNVDPPHKKEYALRLTLLKKGRILREYDFMQRTALRREDALSRIGWQQTFKTLKEVLNNNGKRPLPEIAVSQDPWLISDLHFDHENIIKYCHRPFKDKEEMNKICLENWNNTINDKDDVFFLGDMSFGKGSHSSDYWLKKLKGKIYFIKGNHEEVHYDTSYAQAILKYNGQRFFLIHDPALVPKDWHDWTIHGHKHNNDMREFPLINKEKRTINVSCELLNYKPIRLTELIAKID